jgi:hypothetical protein
MATQTADMAQVMKFNQAAFQKLAVAQVPVRVVPVQNDDGTVRRGFVLLIEGAYAAEMRPVDGQKTGCIFFNSSVPEKQIQQLQQATIGCSRKAKNMEVGSSLRYTARA